MVTSIAALRYPEFLRALLLFLWAFLPVIAGEREVRSAFAQEKNGVVVLPSGQHLIGSEIIVPAGTKQIRGDSSRSTTLRMAPGFQGKALLVIAGLSGLTVSGLNLHGGMPENEVRSGWPPSNIPFRDFSRRNAILVDEGNRVALRNLKIEAISAYAVLVSRSRSITIEGVSVILSGSRNFEGTNNGTGGILLEDGTAEFQVIACRFTQIAGNAVWTHSRFEAPRNGPGRIAGNEFHSIGRDAIQVGHATRVLVEQNRGQRIGYPFEAVDTAGGGIPVVIDTAGNVDASKYRGNEFHEVNGKCIDLDGFHHGEVLNNICVNRGKAEDYPSGSYAIVFNNNNPQMKSEAVVVSGNRMEGVKFGAVFLLGSGHRIERNQFLRINLAGCPETHVQFGCLYFPGEPDFLSAGIYLGASAADWSRQEPASSNLIRDNVIRGHGMSKRCVVASPKTTLTANNIGKNECKEAE